MPGMSAASSTRRRPQQQEAIGLLNDRTWRLAGRQLGCGVDKHGNLAVSLGAEVGAVEGSGAGEGQLVGVSWGERRCGHGEGIPLSVGAGGHRDGCAGSEQHPAAGI